MICRALGHMPEVIYQKNRSFDVPRNYLDIRVARELLGWHPKIELQDGIVELLEQMKARMDRASKPA